MILKSQSGVFTFNKAFMALLACSVMTSVIGQIPVAEAQTAQERTEKAKKQKNGTVQQQTQSGDQATNQSANEQQQIEQAAQGSLLLNEVVVSATGFEQTVKDAPASISVIPREEIEKGSFHDLTDALRSVQGVAVTGSAGEQDIYMRGLPGQYTLILIDGKRMNTRNSRTNGNSGYEQSFIPPAAAIDRIEVVRGPMSSLYGSDAMGGVINVITRKVPEKWTGSITVDGTANESSQYGNSYGGNYYAAGPLAPNVIGLQMWGRGFKRNEDHIASGTPEKKETDFTGRVTITPNENHDIVLEGGTTNLKRYSEWNTDAPSYNYNERDHLMASYTGRFDWTTAEFSILQEQTKRTSWQWDNKINNYEQSARQPYVVNTVYDGKFTTPFELFGNHTLVTGGQYIQTDLNDQNPGKRDNQNYDFSVDQWALFAEDEWWLTNDFALTGGIRADHHDLYDTHWSPRLYGVWHATENFTLKGGMSSGFRAPDIRSIIPGYAYTTGGRGCYFGDQSNRPSKKNPCGVIIGGEGLEAEKSTSYEFAVIYDNLYNLNLGATYFYTKFKDKIVNQRKYDANGNYALWSEDPRYTVFENLNIDEAVMQGIELTGMWAVTEKIHIRANYTYTDSEQKTGDYKDFPLARTPEHMGNVRIDWQTPVEALNVWGAGNYHGKEINAGLRIGSNGKELKNKLGKVAREYDDYYTFDIGTNYKFSEHVTLNAAVYNLFNKEVSTDEFNNVMEGRRYWISMTSNF